MIKAVYTQMGVIVGEIVEETESTYEINNPVLIITQRESAALVPLLAMMEETSIIVKKDSILSGKAYTPILDIVNNYNTTYGSGLLQVSPSFKL